MDDKRQRVEKARRIKKVKPYIYMMCIAVNILSVLLSRENSENKQYDEIRDKYVKEIEINDILSDNTISKNEIIESSISNEKEEIVEKIIYEESDDLIKMNYPFLEIDFNSLKERNQDLYGYVVINKNDDSFTPIISYPVVQSSDNEYYLRRDIDCNNATSGTVFADYRDDSTNSWDIKVPISTTTLYLHNMSNGTMGFPLNYNLDGDEIGTFYTVDGDVYHLKLMFKTAIEATDLDKLHIEDFLNAEDCINYYSEYKDVSSYYNEEIINEINESNEILSLVTCTPKYENKNGRTWTTWLMEKEKVKIKK